MDKDLLRRLDAVRQLLRQPLSDWAKSYWTGVEKQLERTYVRYYGKTGREVWRVDR